MKVSFLISSIALSGVLVTLGAKARSVYRWEPRERSPLEGKAVVFVESSSDDENANGIRGHLKENGEAAYEMSFYESVVKRLLDILISFFALLLLFPFFLLIAIAIKCDDGGTVFFTQKRVGRGKQFFRIHKFRTMKPTAYQYKASSQIDEKEELTRIGGILRRYSLDELPQLWDIFLGNMSLIGPRPVIPQESSLIALREAYHANEVRPGLTGWAQVNGRDSLSICEKAEKDGEYVKQLGFRMDLCCFVRSFSNFKCDETGIRSDLSPAHRDEKIC